MSRELHIDKSERVSLVNSGQADACVAAIRFGYIALNKLDEFLELSRKRFCLGDDLFGWKFGGNDGVADVVAELKEECHVLWIG